MSIQKQVEELQAAIDAQQAQLDELKALAKEQKKWEPPTGLFVIDPCGYNSVVEFSHDNSLVPAHVDFGLARKTREQAERDAAEIRQFARLLAYRAEFAPGYAVPPSPAPASFVYFSDGAWLAGRHTNWRAETVYFPCDVCLELIKKLNSGEVVL